MAAYAALVSLINDLDLTQTHPRHSFSFESKQIASLSQAVQFLIGFLESCDSHGCSREAAEVLESRIASAAQAAHDVLESHVVGQIHSGSTLRAKVRSYFLLDLQKAIDNMNFVKRKAMQFKGQSGMRAEQPTYSPTTSSERQTSGKNTMVGLDAVACRLMETLVGEASGKLVIPIVGMGGMGKTTLAKYAYEHSLVEHHFDVRCWATVSQEYSPECILIELLFGERRFMDRNVNELGRMLRKYLWGRRYLVILDDMWSIEAWGEIHMFLPDNGNGSRVIVTTRQSNLATSLNSSPLKMRFLDDDESWKLFCVKAFDEGESCPLELEEIGNRIVGKCQGLPLSIVVIAGHLRKFSRAVECWEKVANLMNPISSSEEGEKCMQIIRLSYDQLPAYLKPCFLYMAKFREDEIFSSNKVIRLWVAEGFVRANKGLSLEEVAEDYLNDLVDRNLVIVYQRWWNGKSETCVIHDIVRELCMKVCKKEKFVCVLNSSEGVRRERRDVIAEESDIIKALKSTSDGGSSIVQPVNLRYLAGDLFGRENNMHDLPWSISLFWNLQTLIITRYGEGLTVIAVPQEMWEMVQLRHVEFYEFYLPDPILYNQEECIVFRNLQTLLGARNLGLTEEVCERMPNIKSLCLSYDCSGYDTHNLGRFSKLESLKLYGHDLVQSFTFPSSLQKLDLVSSNLGWGDVGVIIGSLPNLVFLGLSSVRGDQWNLVEEELEQFPSLKCLRITGCDDLMYWYASSSRFPVLVRLHLSFLRELSEIPFDFGDIPTLALIRLDYCSVSAAVSAMRILVEQRSLENQDLQLEVHFFRMEEVERFQEMVQEEDLQSDGLRLFCTNKKIKAF